MFTKIKQWLDAHADADWRNWYRLHSVWIMVVGGVASGLYLALPAFQNLLSPVTFAVTSILVSIFARFTKQPSVPVPTPKEPTPAPEPAPEPPAPEPEPTPKKGKAAWVAICVSLLVSWEGYQKVGHHDPIDPPGVNTVCYGHIEDVKIGDTYTKIQCQEMLASDLPRYDAMVKRCIHVDMPPHRYAAIVSFTYNVGGGALCKSSVASNLNRGNVREGCDALLKYVRANGKYVKGLDNRRHAERTLCLMED